MRTGHGNRLKTVAIQIVLGGIALFLSVPTASSQGVTPKPFRVRSNEVLVPVFVWNNERWMELRFGTSADPQSYQDIMVRDLTAADFRLFEDNVPQRIQRVTFEEPSVLQIGDNQGEHFESTGTGGGRWVYPDIPADATPPAVATWPTYVLTYAPPASPEGSCHRVEVKIINHTDATAISRSGYCKTELSASDPLVGTKFGKQMDDNLSAATNGNIRVSASAVVLFGDSEESLVHIAVEFPPGSLRYKLEHGHSGNLYESIGVLAKIYATNRSVIARMSDFDCCDYTNGAGLDWLIIRNPSGANVLFTPSSYETQFYIAPGKNILAIVVSDGSSFGRVDIPIIVDRVDLKQLSVSDVALAKRSRAAGTATSDVPAKLAGVYVPLVSKNTEFIPAADTHFKNGESFYYYFQVYQPQRPGEPAPPLQAHVRIVDLKTGQPKNDLPSVSGWQYMNGRNPVIPIGGCIDIRNLPKGSYRLEVQASDATGQITPWHSASFFID